MKERLVFAYAGGLQDSLAIPLLAQACHAEVATLTLDLGQGSDLGEVRDRALAAGAVRAHVLDVREEFARDFVLPALQAGALRNGRDPMARALGQPLLARRLLEVAAIERAAAVAHGCTGVDQQRMDANIGALDPQMRVMAAASEAGVPHGGFDNLWGRAYTSTESQIPNPKSQTPGPRSQTPSPESQTRNSTSQRSEEAPATPAHVVITFERGVPVAVNGVPMVLTELIESLSIIAGQHGVGRIALAEADASDGHSHHGYEAPAAVVLHAAHAVLEASVMPREEAQQKRERAIEYARLVWNGLWFTPAREAMDALNTRAQKRMTGAVHLKLFSGTLLSMEAAALDHAAVAGV